MPRKRITRRKAIAGLSTIGSLTLAGCTGDGGDGGGGGDGGDDGDGGDGGDGDGGDGDGGDGGGGGGGQVQTLKMVTSTDSTAAYQMSQGLAAVMDEHSDSIVLDARPADGARQGMRLLDQGRADIAYTDLLNAFRIFNDVGQYEEKPFENDIRQLWHFYDIQSSMVVAGDSDLWTYHDLGGTTVSPHPAGSAQRAVWELVLEKTEGAGDIQTISLDYNQEPSALQSGRSDVVTDLRINVDLLPSYNQELYSVNDEPRLLHFPEELAQQIQDDDRLTGSYYSAENMGGGGENTDAFYATEDGGTREEEFWMETVYVAFAKPSLDSDLVYNFMKTMRENADVVPEYHSLGEAWKDEEFWVTNMHPNIPVHEGARRLYDELELDYPTP